MDQSDQIIDQMNRIQSRCKANVQRLFQSVQHGQKDDIFKIYGAKK
jgi:hypothetical protein